MKKATEKVAEMQQIVEKTLKEDEKLRKKGIIPRLSTDIFDEPFDFDEIQSIVNEMETTNQNVKTESSETATVKTEINDNSNETSQITDPILIEDDVKLEEVKNNFWKNFMVFDFYRLKYFLPPVIFRHRHGMILINGLMTSQVMSKCRLGTIRKKGSRWTRTRMMRTKMRMNQRET